MTIIANAFYVSGEISNMTLHANTLDANGYSNITVADNLKVGGSIFTDKRMDVGSTIFATFRLASNMSFNNPSQEVTGTSNLFTMDWTSTDMSGMSDIPLKVPSYRIYNQGNGEITVPVSGLYHLEMQGVFQNTGNAINGVYYRFTNLPYPSARMSAKMTTGNIVSTSHSAFLLAGDRFIPTFYSNDPGAILVPSNGETYIRFVVAATVTPSHSNYVRSA